MRDKRADLVEDVHARGDDQRDRHHPQRKHTRRNQHDQRDRPDAACSLKPQPQPRRLALRHTTPEGGVDRQRRIALDQYTVHPRHHQRQRGQDAIAHDQRERRQDRGQNEQRQRPWLHRRERQIFGILARAIARARVVEVVDAFIHEARHQQRNARDQIPPQPETGQRGVPDMRDFVDEAAGAIERKHRDHTRHDCPANRRQRHRQRERGIADPG